MVINELITNSVKYAFEEQTDKRIHIVCRRMNDDVWITAEDNCSSIDASFNIQNSLRIGFSIIRAIAKIDLRGRIDVKNNGYGTIAAIRIPACLA